MYVNNHDLKAKNSVKLNIVESQFQEILRIRTKVIKLENEVMELKNKFGKFRNSSFLLNEIIEVNSTHQKSGKAGLGFVEISPPFHNDYNSIPNIGNLKHVDVDSHLTIDPPVTVDKVIQEEKYKLV